jgi:hypothetical protein
MPLVIGIAGGSALGESGAASRLPALESRVVPAYNPPVKSSRPFAADYPSGAQTDAVGGLTTDIEGRPLGARYVAGRRMVGEPDEALSPAAVDAVATEATGQGPEAVASRQIRGDAARLTRTVDPDTGATDWNIWVNRTLSDPQKDRVVAHEVGHLIDELSGRIPTGGITTELKQVYNTLTTGREGTRNLTGPQHLGYSDEAADRELMAEAIRGYLTDPNYLKTVAPKTAARIRAYVNANPRLAALIQFNAIGAAALAPSANWKGAQMPFDPDSVQPIGPTVSRYDGGGTVDVAPPAYLGAVPQVQGLYQRFANLPLDKLQQLAVMMPPTSLQGQMIQRALKAKQMAPASMAAFPSSSPSATVPAFPSTSGTPTSRRGGGIPPLRRDAGGSAPVLGGTTYTPSAAYGVALPMMSFSAGNPGEVGPSWSPGQALLSPSSQATTTPPGFGSAAAAPLTTPLPASVTGANAPAAAAPTASTAYAYMPGLPSSMGSSVPYNPQTGIVDPTWAQQYGFGSGMTLGGVEGYLNSINGGGGGTAARGGRLPQRRAYGGLGVAPTPEQTGMFDIHRSNSAYHPGGFIDSAVAGRTDDLPMAVAADSHVIPADVVSGLGEGNSLNGAALLDRMFHSGPWGARAIGSRVPATMPRPPRPMPAYATGGPPSPSRNGLGAAGRERRTEILAAGGEYVVRPEAVAEIGRRAKARNPLIRKSDIAAGHDAIDRFIVEARKHVVATTKKLPGPVKS